ncbi:hypothetical protein CDIK_0458 [Cucumispora dikerogammari]|nr:hypothetical protein CDIK_0458 [Cucumispora dikerogammari]
MSKTPNEKKDFLNEAAESSPDINTNKETEQNISVVKTSLMTLEDYSLNEMKLKNYNKIEFATQNELLENKTVPLSIEFTNDIDIMDCRIEHDCKNKRILDRLINDLDAISYSEEVIIRTYRNLLPLIKYLTIEIFKEKYLTKIKLNSISQGKYYNEAFNILQQNIFLIFEVMDDSNSENIEENTKIIKLIHEFLYSFYIKKPVETLSLFIYSMFKINVNVFEEEFQNEVFIEMCNLQLQVFNYKVYREIMECKSYLETKNNAELIMNFNELNILVDENETLYFNYTQEIACIDGLEAMKIPFENSQNNTLENVLSKLHLSDSPTITRDNAIKHTIKQRLQALKNITKIISINTTTRKKFETKIHKNSYFNLLEVTDILYDNIFSALKNQISNVESTVEINEYFGLKKIDLLHSSLDEVILQQTIDFVLLYPIETYTRIQIFDPKAEILIKILKQCDFFTSKNVTEVLSFAFPKQIQVLEMKLSDNFEFFNELKSRQVQEVLFSQNTTLFDYSKIFKKHFSPREKSRAFYNLLLHLKEQNKPIDFEIYRIFIDLFPLIHIPQCKKALKILIEELKINCKHVSRKLDLETTFSEETIKNDNLFSQVKKITNLNFKCSLFCTLQPTFLLIVYYVFREFKAVLNSTLIDESRRIFYYFECSEVFGVSYSDILVQQIIVKVEAMHKYRSSRFKFKLGDKPTKLITPAHNKLLSFMDRLLFINTVIKTNVEREDLLLLHWRVYVKLMRLLFNKMDKGKFKEIFSNCAVKCVRKEVEKLFK